MSEIKFIELFAGIGGFRYGLENASTPTRYEQGVLKKSPSMPLYNGRAMATQQFTCVYANEFNKYAAQIYERNFNEKPDTRDIREVDASEIPDHDLLTAGFPCQAFSIAGKRGGFEDTRGTLFFEIARIAKQKQPRLLLLENVKGLLSHDKGKTFGTILNTLDELGYDCQWQVLNSKNFGVPQNRERVFIVGHLRGTSRPEVFPIGYENSKDVQQGTEKQSGRSWVSTLDSRYGERWSTETYVRPLRWVRTEKGREFRRNAKKEFGRDLTPFNADHRKLVESKENIVGTITNAIAKDALLNDTNRVRRLTPTECERLQGFPDGWTEGISDTQRYKCLGNAVTTNVITAIGNKLKESK